MSRRRSTIISLALLLALTLAMFADVLFAGGTRVLGNQASDLFLQYYAWRDFGFSELAKGNLALWNPHIFSGAPYFGGMQGAQLYPPNWIFLILPLPVAINWSVALHVFAIGAFMFLWMRQRGLNAPSSFFAGATVMFCGAFFPHVFAGHLPQLCAMTWAPLIFCAIDALFENIRLPIRIARNVRGRDATTRWFPTIPFLHRDHRRTLFSSQIAFRLELATRSSVAKHLSWCRTPRRGAATASDTDNP